MWVARATYSISKLVVTWEGEASKLESSIMTKDMFCHLPMPGVLLRSRGLLNSLDTFFVTQTVFSKNGQLSTRR